MHELSLCQALIATASRQMDQHPGKRIARLAVSVGALSGCEPDLLAHLFPHASPGTAAEGAQLEIAFQPARVACSDCGQSHETHANRLCCPVCGGMNVRLEAGDGVFLTSLVLKENAGCA